MGSWSTMMSSSGLATQLTGLSVEAYQAAMMGMMNVAIMVSSANGPVSLSGNLTFNTVGGGALSPGNEVPSLTLPAVGAAVTVLIYDDMFFDITVGPVSSAITKVHFHGPAYPSQVVPFLVDVINYTVSNNHVRGFVRNAINDPTFLNAMLSGQMYANIHTAMYPGGEARGPVVAQVPGPTPFDGCSTGLCAAEFGACWSDSMCWLQFETVAAAVVGGWCGDRNSCKNLFAPQGEVSMALFQNVIGCFERCAIGNSGSSPMPSMPTMPTTVAVSSATLQLRQNCSGAGGLACSDFTNRCARDFTFGAIGPFRGTVSGCPSGSVTAATACTIIVQGQNSCPSSLDLGGICLGVSSCVVTSISAAGDIAPSFLLVVVGLLSAILLF